MVVLESILDSPNYHLVMVQSAQEALHALLKTDFSAVLLEVKMPDRMGYDLARLIHRRKVGHCTDKTDVRFGYEAGGLDYVCTPFDPVEGGGLRRTVPAARRVDRRGRTLRDEITRLRQAITT